MKFLKVCKKNLNKKNKNLCFLLKAKHKGLWACGLVAMTSPLRGEGPRFESEQAHDKMFIKKLFEGEIDESVHKQFVRFGKGSYSLRAIINVRKNDKIKVTTSFELANDLVGFVSNLAEKFSINGIILSKEPIQGLEFKKKNILSCEINKEIKAKDLKELSAKAYATLLDCSAQGISLKMKKKLPRPKKSAELKVDDKFCMLELDKKFWEKFHEDFLFDLPHEFKKARIEHTYIIEEIIIPKEIQNEKDFEKIRLMAKRKGKIIRKIVVDGKEIIKEKHFEA